ncbi:MAG: hypothetical protein ACHQSE_02460 [Gemmatimonadales bacterium]
MRSSECVVAVHRHQNERAFHYIYHQFGSKTGLIETVFDSLAVVQVGVPRLVAALNLDDPLTTLDVFVQTRWPLFRGHLRERAATARSERAHSQPGPESSPEQDLVNPASAMRVVPP